MVLNRRIPFDGNFFHNPLKGDDTITTTATAIGRNYRQSLFANEDDSRCPICNSTERIVDSQKAEVTCAKCGLVLDENRIDPGAEWRAYNIEERDKRARAGAPATYRIADKGLATDISNYNRDAHGRSIPEMNRQQVYRLRKWNKRMRVSNAGERNLAFALSELERLSSRLTIPRSVREEAAMIYRNAARQKLIRGRSIESMVAASLYTACRRCSIPRTLEEISEASKVSKKQLGKNYRFVCRKLKIKLQPTSPADYIPRFSSHLGVSCSVETKALEILQIADKKGLNSGKGPNGIAAASIYLASILVGERKTQREVAEAAGVTEVTIRNRCRDLNESINVAG